jgi:hypothetical protein
VGKNPFMLSVSRCEIELGRGVVVVQFGLRTGPVKREIPSASLRAGSSLRLKNGYAQDDNHRVIVKLHHYQGVLVKRASQTPPSVAVAPQGRL